VERGHPWRALGSRMGAEWEVAGAAGEPLCAAADAVAALVDLGLGWPEVNIDYPWGEAVLKVRGKVFAFLGAPTGQVGMTLKLPLSQGVALALPGCAPAGYNLGKSGWVSMRLDPGQQVPLGVLRGWLVESFRAVAPKTVAARLPPVG
jgi:predicted DNA-binding protein (MmcQ/YjbR family)